MAHSGSASTSAAKIAFRKDCLLLGLFHPFASGVLVSPALSGFERPGGSPGWGTSMRFFAAALLASVGVSVPAQAAIVTYNVNATYQNGKMLAGSFDFDTAGATRDAQFSNVSLSIDGLAFDSINTFELRRDLTGPVTIGSSTSLGFLLFSFAGTFDATRILSIEPGALGNRSQFVNRQGGPRQDLVSGTISLAAAVPEPTTWAMMIGGFGLVGSAMRRRQKATVTFA